MEVDVKEDAYYNFISALQKCVRRGLEHEAVVNAKAAHKLSASRMFARLHTIVFEECSIDPVTLRMLYDVRTGKDFAPLEPLVRQMAKGYHNRDTIVVSRTIRGLNKWYAADHFAQLRAKSPKFGELMTLWPTHELDSYLKLGLSDEYLWVLELAERSKKFDRELICCGTPFFYLDYSRTPEVNECMFTDMLSDLGLPEVPDCTFDGHTRIGKFAVTVTAKKSGVGLSQDDLKVYVFYQDGYFLNRRAEYPLGAYAMHMARHDKIKLYVSKESTTYWKETFYPRLKSIRRWALEKCNEPTLNFMKETIRCVS